MKPDYRKTMYACFIAYIVQAVVVCFAPLLFVTFQTEYGIPLARITLLITVTFTVQLVVDFLSAGFVDRIGYRAAALLAHGCAAVGLVCLALLPALLPDPFWGLLAAACIYAVGGYLGCSVGPTLAGMVSSRFGDNLRTGILTSILFPAVLLVSVLALSRKDKAAQPAPDAGR